MPSTAGLPPPRTLVHPGRPDPERISSMLAPGARHLRLVLQPGRSLHEGVVEPLYARGIRHASMTLFGGSFSVLEFCVAGDDPSGRALAAYSAPHQAGRAWLLAGNATLGLDLHGAPALHCHAALRTGDGEVRGGHLLTDRCLVGEEPATVWVSALDGFELRMAHDVETNLPLLRPVPMAAHA